jgi:hypothetical protein
MKLTGLTGAGGAKPQTAGPVTNLAVTLAGSSNTKVIPTDCFGSSGPDLLRIIDDNTTNDKLGQASGSQFFNTKRRYLE